MYIFAFLAVIVSAIFMVISSSAEAGYYFNYMDFFSLLVLLLLCIPILISSKLAKDFNNGFKILFKKGKEASLTEIKRAIEAIELTMRTLLYSGMFIFSFYGIIILKTTKDIAEIGPNLAVALLSLIYALAINILLLPVRSRLKVKMIEYIHKL